MQRAAVNRGGISRRFDSSEVLDEQRVTYFRYAELQKCKLEIVLHTARRGRGERRALKWKFEDLLTNWAAATQRPSLPAVAL